MESIIIVILQLFFIGLFMALCFDILRSSFNGKPHSGATRAWIQGCFVIPFRTLRSLAGVDTSSRSQNEKRARNTVKNKSSKKRPSRQFGQIVVNLLTVNSLPPHANRLRKTKPKYRSRRRRNKRHV